MSVKVGQWVAIQTKAGAIVQGRASRVTASSVTIDGKTYDRALVQWSLGPMTIDKRGVVKQNPLAGPLPGERVKRLMREHGWTIEGIARAMNVTQARVRQVRERGVTEGPHYVRDWIEVLTRKGNPMATKRPTAAQLAARKLFAERARAGTLKKAGKRKPNPLTRVKRTSPSMATGKAPSKRLVKRRAKTARAPAGYYANPASRAPAAYAVHRVNANGAQGALIARFSSKADAVQYGKAYANLKRCQVAIIGKSR